MGIIEYLSVLVSILIGLSIADIVTSFHKLMRNRKRVVWDWISPVLAITMLLQVLGFWWIWMEIYAGRPSVSLAYFIPDIVVFILLFLACAIVLPDEFQTTKLDLREYYWSTVPYFWIVFLIMGLVFMIFITPRFYQDSDIETIVLSNIPNIVLNIGVVVMILWRNKWVHMSFIGLLFAYSVVIQLASVINGPSG